MGATTTAAVACAIDDWTLIADGATYGSVGLQTIDASYLKVAIAIAASKPSLGSDDWFMLPPDGWSGTLGTGDKVYGRSLNSIVKVRTYRTAV